MSVWPLRARTGNLRGSYAPSGRMGGQLRFPPMPPARLFSRWRARGAAPAERTRIRAPRERMFHVKHPREGAPRPPLLSTCFPFSHVPRATVRKALSSAHDEAERKEDPWQM